MDFATAARIMTTTENGMTAHFTTGSAVLDFFSVAGALRNQDESRICDLFEKAYQENATYAARTMFYARDIRGGLGERDTFRTLLRYCAFNHSEVVFYALNKNLIGEYGRYDDIYCLIDTPVEDYMWKKVREWLEEDYSKVEKGQSPSLLAKWLKTADASSANTRKLGIRTALGMGIPVRNYKRIIRYLRKAICTVESQMSAQEWDKINYSAVPSQAMRKYSEAFTRQDGSRFADYMDDVAAGKKEIKASTLYPYEVLESYPFRSSWWYSSGISAYNKVAEAQWKALPNYVEPGSSVMVIADTSGSMTGRPMTTALSLAVYFAERNEGAYHNLWMSFSSDSTVHTLKGNTLQEKINNIDMNDWGGSTNLEKAFMHILDIAVKNNVPQDQMVKSIVVISDMEIDHCVSSDWSFYNEMSRRYMAQGYYIPNVVFWNVESRHNIFHVDGKRAGVQLCSGASASTFRTLLNSIGKDAYSMMESVLTSDRYSVIRL